MSDDENYCDTHDVDVDALPADYDECPYCREERRANEMAIERAQRTTWVDDPHDPHGYGR